MSETSSETENGSEEVNLDSQPTVSGSGWRLSILEEERGPEKVLDAFLLSQGRIQICDLSEGSDTAVESLSDLTLGGDEEQGGEKVASEWTLQSSLQVLGGFMILFNSFVEQLALLILDGGI
jgi:hypothetical protein